MMVVLPAPVAPTIAQLWPGSTVKETSRKTPRVTFVLVLNIIDIITKPDVSEFDSTFDFGERNRRVCDLERFVCVEQSKYSLCTGHRALQRVVLIAQVSDGFEGTVWHTG